MAPVSQSIDPATAADEREHRFVLWKTLTQQNLGSLEPAFVRQLGVYGGAQGIWVDKVRTAHVASEGVTVGILHTGEHYPDDLSAEGMIYHYPTTRRSAGRDISEVEATKNSLRLDLPIFVVLPGERSAQKRTVRLGWVRDYDDLNRQFLILFGDQPPLCDPVPPQDGPFALQTTGNQSRKLQSVASRSSQQTFRFNIFAKYGAKCAVCRISHSTLLAAAHICGKRDRGTDDWRNGLPLCATHHAAFDAHLFAIEPSTHELVCKPGTTAEQIGLASNRVDLLSSLPHREALLWRWNATQRKWRNEQMLTAQEA